MKRLFTGLLFVLSIAGCSGSDSGDKFVGNWSQVHTKDVPPIAAAITKEDSGYRIELTMTIPGQTPAKMSKTGKFENGALKAEGIESITLIEGTGHIMIGANEFQKSK